MVRAQAAGVIDFHEARLLDANWWRRSALLLHSMARRDDQAVLAAAHQYHCSLLGNSGLTEESFKATQVKAQESFHELLSLLQPWAKDAWKPGNEINEMANMYRNIVKEIDGTDLSEAVSHDVAMIERGKEKAEEALGDQVLNLIRALNKKRRLNRRKEAHADTKH
jgi:hypothetical protein